jgi:hypothetical protein
MTTRVLPVVLLALALAHTASVVVPRPVPRDVPAGARRVLPRLTVRLSTLACSSSFARVHIAAE